MPDRPSPAAEAALWRDLGADVVAEYRARTPRSAAWAAEAAGSTPGGDVRRITWHAPYPVVAEGGEGAHLRDLDGHRYLDLLNNYASLLHGHRHGPTVEAIVAQARRGTAFAAPTRVQADLAALLVARVASIEAVRFVNSGTEAGLHVARAARAATGRRTILKFEGGYHGVADPLDVSVHPDPGAAGPATAPAPVPESPGVTPGAYADTVVAPYNDAEATARLIRAHARDLAAVFVEPVLGSGGVIAPRPGFLETLESEARAVGALVVADEVMTLRLARGGAQGLLGLRPDLTILGKIVGGGLPVGGFGGRAGVMALFAPPDGPLVQSGTFSANPVTMAAGLATLRAFDSDACERINGLGGRLAEGLRRAAARAAVRLTVTQAGSLLHLHFTAGPVTDYRSARAGSAGLARVVHLAMLNRGVFFAPKGFMALSTATTETDVDRAGDALEDALRALRGAVARGAPHLLA